ncbi:unnamed protein product [Linum tenue]|uniref:L-type lectin-like domain-containing protein n=1 Tax=Linum tenue TaxID=586396 RepID=A0AAV0I3W9_9ROSI|nr:unnamed protein product [Linum tenue]
MYVGFTASTGQLVQSHKILAWSFSNSNFPLSESLITTGLPSFVLPSDSNLQLKGFNAGVTAGSLVLVIDDVLSALFLIRRRRKTGENKDEEMGNWELEYWPHKIAYQGIAAMARGLAGRERSLTGGERNGDGQLKIIIKKN